MKHIPAILLTLFVVAGTIYTINAWLSWQIVFNLVVGLIVAGFVLRFLAAALNRQ